MAVKPPQREVVLSTRCRCYGKKIKIRSIHVWTMATCLKVGSTYTHRKEQNKTHTQTHTRPINTQ